MPFVKRFFFVLALLPLIMSAADIGMVQTIRIEIPGEKLQAVPLDDYAPVAIRLDVTTKTETGHLYSIDFVGFEPGEYNVMNYVRTPSGTPPAVAPYPVIVRRELPEYFHGEIQDIPRRVGFPPAWYGKTALTLIVLWALCLPLLVFADREKRDKQPVPQVVPLSLREQLRSRLSEIGPDESKETWQRLEATLISYLADARQVTEGKAYDQLMALKNDTIAGRAIREFEQCLHAPGGRRRASLDRALEACARVLEVTE